MHVTLWDLYYKQKLFSKLQLKPQNKQSIEIKQITIFIHDFTTWCFESYSWTFLTKLKSKVIGYKVLPEVIIQRNKT